MTYFSTEINSFGISWSNGNVFKRLVKSVKDIIPKGFGFIGYDPYNCSLELNQGEGLCYLDNIPEFEWLANRSFYEYKYFIFNHTGWPYGEDWIVFSRFLMFGSSKTIIMKENYISQKLIDLFKEKASKHPDKVFVISAFVYSQRVCYKISDNFNVYLTYCRIEDGLINHLSNK